MALVGKVDDLARLLHPGSRLRRGLRVLEDCQAGRRPEVMQDLSTLAPGASNRIPLEGDALYLIIQCYKPKRRTEGRFEAHERHTDLQFIWSGRECIEVCDLHACAPSASYEASGNLYFPLGDSVHHRLLLRAGDVAVLLPQDAHAPCLRPEEEDDELVRKIVVKVLDAHLIDSSGAALTAGSAPVCRDGGGL